MGRRGLIVGKSRARLFPYYLPRDHQPRVRKEVAMTGVKVQISRTMRENPRRNGTVG